MIQTPCTTVDTLDLDTVGSWRGTERSRSVAVVGKPTETNRALVTALADLGHRARLVFELASLDLAPGDVAIGRIDVLPTLDGVEPELWRLSRLERPTFTTRRFRPFRPRTS
jgi:hypothetical protein